jgi:futalosine hydrolase
MFFPFLSALTKIGCCDEENNLTFPIVPYNQILDYEVYMFLIAVATENEKKPLEQFLAAVDQLKVLVTGIGPVTTAASLSNYLTLHGSRIDGVLNIGVAGAYIGSGLAKLDICLARQEFLGDFGICMPDGIQDFDPGLLKPGTSLLFNNDLVPRFENILKDKNIAFKVVNFVTVNCCSGTAVRGEFLREKFSAGCENMEGAAVAMVCKNFNIPCVELRSVSNMVKDRDTESWQLAEAIEKICMVAEVVLHEYVQGVSSHD